MIAALIKHIILICRAKERYTNMLVDPNIQYRMLKLHARMINDCREHPPVARNLTTARFASEINLFRRPTDNTITETSKKYANCH